MFSHSSAARSSSDHASYLVSASHQGDTYKTPLTEQELLFWAVKGGHGSFFEVLMGPHAAKLEASFEKRKEHTLLKGKKMGKALELNALYKLVTYLLDQSPYQPLKEILSAKEGGITAFLEEYESHIESLSLAQPVQDGYVRNRFDVLKQFFNSNAGKKKLAKDFKGFKESIIKYYKYLVMEHGIQETAPEFVNNNQNSEITITQMRWFGVMYDRIKVARKNADTWIKSKLVSDFLNTIFEYHSHLQEDYKRLLEEEKRLEKEIEEKQQKALSEYEALFNDMRQKAESLENMQTNDFGIPPYEYAGVANRARWNALKKRIETQKIADPEWDSKDKAGYYLIDYAISHPDIFNFLLRIDVNVLALNDFQQTAIERIPIIEDAQTRLKNYHALRQVFDLEPEWLIFLKTEIINVETYNQSATTKSSTETALDKRDQKNNQVIMKLPSAGFSETIIDVRNSSPSPIEKVVEEAADNDFSQGFWSKMWSFFIKEEDQEKKLKVKQKIYHSIKAVTQYSTVVQESEARLLQDLNMTLKEALSENEVNTHRKMLKNFDRAMKKVQNLPSINQTVVQLRREAEITHRLMLSQLNDRDAEKQAALEEREAALEKVAESERMAEEAKEREREALAQAESAQKKIDQAKQEAEEKARLVEEARAREAQALKEKYAAQKKAEDNEKMAETAQKSVAEAKMSASEETERRLKAEFARERALIEEQHRREMLAKEQEWKEKFEREKAKHQEQEKTAVQVVHKGLKKTQTKQAAQSTKPTVDLKPPSREATAEAQPEDKGGKLNGAAAKPFANNEADKDVSRDQMTVATLGGTASLPSEQVKEQPTSDDPSAVLMTAQSSVYAPAYMEGGNATITSTAAVTPGVIAASEQPKARNFFQRFFNS